MCVASKVKGGKGTDIEDAVTLWTESKRSYKTNKLVRKDPLVG